MGPGPQLIPFHTSCGETLTSGAAPGALGPGPVSPQGNSSSPTHLPSDGCARVFHIRSPKGLISIHGSEGRLGSASGDSASVPDAPRLLRWAPVRPPIPLAAALGSATAAGVEGSLGRVLDPVAVDADPGARARLRLDVPEAWLVEGADLELTVPRRLACARCDGGGCDGCDRSGVVRAPEDVTDRTLHAHIPSLAGEPGVALRITQPFGPDHPIAQLHLELRAAAGASAGVRRVDAPIAPAPLPLALSWPFIAGLLTLAAAVAALLAR